MAKWALWTAHRYVTAGAAVPRTIGPDGRPLARPWRSPRADAVAAARRARAARPQPIWPKVVGWVCIGVASWAALSPVGPLPRHVPLSAAKGPGPDALRPAIAISPVEHLPARGGFRWQAGPTQPPFTFVLLDLDYRELVRVDGIEETPWQPPAHVRELLVTGAVYHAYVLAGQEHDTWKSPLVSFDWR